MKLNKTLIFMKQLKPFLLPVAIAITAIVVAVGATMCSNREDTSLCKKVDIIIEDSLSHNYINVVEIEKYLKSHSCYSLGQTMNQIDCYAIEQTLLAHDMIRTVNCYKTALGTVCINITQCVPVYAITLENEIFWVNSDRCVISAPAGADVDLLMITGNITKESAVEDFFDFVAWIENSEYWKNRLTKIHVKDTNDIVLYQSDYESIILLGSLEEYQEKLDRLQKLYTNGFDRIGYPECQELDLRFKGQVVTR